MTNGAKSETDITDIFPRDDASAHPDHAYKRRGGTIRL